MNEEAHYQHMIAVENRLETIENLLRELVTIVQMAEDRKVLAGRRGQLSAKTF